jgi:hypothetical protein
MRLSVTASKYSLLRTGTWLPAAVLDMPGLMRSLTRLATHPARIYISQHLYTDVCPARAIRSEKSALLLLFQVCVYLSSWFGLCKD